MEAAIVVCSRDLRRHDNPALHQALAACPSDLVDVPTYLFLVQGDIDHVGAGGRLAGKCGETGYNGHRIASRRAANWPGAYSAAAPVSIC